MRNYVPQAVAKIRGNDNNPHLLGTAAFYAQMSFYNKRFTIPEIYGKSIIIHGSRDDFTSQPSGMSGDKIACGVIMEA